MDSLKQKSISQMTIKELRQMRRRLELESEVEQAILRVKRNNGEKWNENTRPIVNTTTPIDQMYPTQDELFVGKTISQLSLPELSILRDRLYDETRAQEQILEMKRISGENWDWDDQPEVSTNTPVNQLYHYGIPGMRWGIRNKRESIGKKGLSKTGTEKPPVPKAEDFIKSRRAKAKGLAGLSNDELKKLNERLNLEKQYKDLTNSERQKNKRLFTESVESGLKQTATTVVAAGSLYAVKRLIEKSMGANAAKEMFPKKK